MLKKISKDYNKKGKKNKTINKLFIKICKMSQTELKKFLNKELSKYYKNIIAQDGFLYCKGQDKILLTAHMDTVHKETVKVFYEYNDNGKHIVSSPQGIGGDDRCGVYMILKILETTTLRPYILFCEDEEIGGIGSDKFCERKFINDLKEMMFLIELDRQGSNDLVYYNDENEMFHDFAERTTGYRENWGSFSDISNLSPACEIASVNISCGYYNAHTTSEYVVLEEMEKSIEAVINMMIQGLQEGISYNYIEHRYERYRFNDYSWLEDRINTIHTRKDRNLQAMIYFMEYQEEEAELLEGESELEIWGLFFSEHPTVCMNDVLDYEIDDHLEEAIAYNLAM